MRNNLQYNLNGNQKFISKHSITNKHNEFAFFFLNNKLKPINKFKFLHEW